MFRQGWYLSIYANRLFPGTRQNWREKVKMRSIPLTRARHARNFAIALKNRGVPVEGYLGRAHLPVDLLADGTSDSVISALAMLDFAENAAADTGVRDLGYWAGILSIKDFGDFGAHVAQAPSLHGAIQAFCSRVRGECSEADYYLVSNESKAWFCHGPIGNGFLQQQHELYALMIMVQVIRLALGADWQPVRLRMQQSNEAGLADNDFLVGLNIEFGATATSIEIPLGKLATRIDGTESSLYNGRGSHPSLDASFFPTDPMSALHELISDHIRRSKKPSLEFAARVAGISTRSLQRYLRSKSTSYAGVVDQVRFNMAIPLLKDDSVSISEIAHELGYANVAHFSRAFSRITGMSPRSYRGLLKK